MIGLTQHLRRSHEERYHREEVGQAVSHRRWTRGMLVRLAQEELRLQREGVRFINQELAEAFPEYAVESIKGQRNESKQYAEIIEEERQKLEQLQEDVADHPEGGIEPLRQAIKDQVNTLDIVGTGGIAEVVDSQEFIEDTMERAFPVIRRQSRGKGEAHSVSHYRNAKQKWRALFRKAQSMYRRDTGRLVDKILNDSLEAPDTPVPDNADDFWTELLERVAPDSVPKARVK